MGSTTLKVEDLVVRIDARDRVMSRIEDKIDYKNLVSYSKRPLRLSMYPPNRDADREHYVEYGRFMVAAYDHVTYVLESTDKLINLFDNVDKVVLRNSGIESTWRIEDVTWLMLTKESVVSMLEPVLTLATTESESTVLKFYFNDRERLSEKYRGDSNVSLTLRAYWQARYSMLENAFDDVPNDYGIYLRMSEGSVTVDFAKASALSFTKFAMNLRKTPSIDSLRKYMQIYRAELLRVQTARQAQDKLVARSLASQNFTSYWDSMKRKQVAPSLEDAVAAWSTIPIPEPGTRTSRTWGIEVETVHAERTRTPRGWDDKYDGSLVGDNDYDNCDCGCDDCCEYDSHCGYDDCNGGEDSSCREFVSPILSWFNSAGLRQLCSDIGAEETNNTPGIHVHVGADGLNVADIGRLLFAYSAVSRYIQPLYYRQKFEYCHEQPFNNVHWWMSMAKQYIHSTGDIPTPHDLVHQSMANRYVDVNLCALNAHGTIEFRSMGPRYDYEHLVRWAWFCREMVNVSRLNIDNSEWLACRSVADVIALLRRYGSELPDTSQFASVDINAMLLDEE